MSEYIPKILDILSGLLTLIIIPLAVRYISNQKVRDAILLLNEQAKLAVDRLNRERRELQDPARPGTWSAEQGERLKNAAISEVVRVLGDSYSVLVSRYGTDSQVMQLINNAIEAHVERTRQQVLSSRTSSIPAAPLVPTPGSLPVDSPLSVPAAVSPPLDPSSPASISAEPSSTAGSASGDPAVSDPAVSDAEAPTPPDGQRRVSAASGE